MVDFQNELYEEKGFPWGELSPVGRLRGVGVMYMSYFAVTPLRHRCAMLPAPGRLLLPYGQFTLSPRGEALLFCCLIF